MLDSKLSRLKQLIDLKEKTDRELGELLGEQPKQKRGRPKKEEPGTEAPGPQNQ